LLEVLIQDLMDIYSTTEFYDQDDIQEFHASTMPGLDVGTRPGF